jgi:putative flippase GtrA
MSDSTAQGFLSALNSKVRFGQFVSVGVIGAISDNIMLIVLTLGVGIHEVIAKAVGIETAIVVMFLVNEYWTFSEKGDPGRIPFLKRAGKSHLVRAGGAGIQIVIYTLLTQRLSYELVVMGTDLWFLAASPIAIAVAMVVNYVFESLFTWQVHVEE